MQNNPLVTQALDLITASIKSRSFWLDVRIALLMFVDTIERQQCIEPRTSEIRRKFKKNREGWKKEI